MRIYKEFFVEAAHRLPGAPPGDPNARVHGHSFRVRITLAGEPDAKTGMVFPFGEMSAAIERVRRELDHRFLNDVADLSNPTLERIAGFIWDRLAPALPGLAEVTVARDTCQEGCVYTGPQQAER